MEVEQANKAAKVHKEKMVLEEHERDQEIIRYNQKKDREEAERIRLEKKFKAEKERAVAVMLDLQERAQGQLEDEGAVRAQRAYEESERKSHAEQKMKEEK